LRLVYDYMEWKFKYTELGPPVHPRNEWPKLLQQDSMTQIKAGNTIETLKPKEVCGTLKYDTPEGYYDPVAMEQFSQMHSVSPGPIPQVSSELNCPNIDEVAPILPESKNENFQLPEEPEPLPTIAIWQLRGRVIELERRLDELADRIASFNVRSSYKL